MLLHPEVNTVSFYRHHRLSCEPRDGEPHQSLCSRDCGQAEGNLQCLVELVDNGNSAGGSRDIRIRWQEQSDV
jgi:hypothetical protein